MKKAVIFDLDGVISHTQQFHNQAERKVLSNYNIHVTTAFLEEKYAGVSDEEMFMQLFRSNNLLLDDIEKVIGEKWKLMKRLSKEKIKPIPHALSLIGLLKKNGYKLAVASGSPMRYIEFVLQQLGLKNTFDTIASSEEVLHGKPATDIFLLTAKRLGIKPENIVVIEDGRSGMMGAKHAHMKCIGLVKNKKDSYEADILVTSLKQITIKTIDVLLERD